MMMTTDTDTTIINTNTNKGNKFFQKKCKTIIFSLSNNDNKCKKSEENFEPCSKILIFLLQYSSSHWHSFEIAF